MGISLHLDVRHFLTQIKKLDVEDRIPEFVAKTLAARIRDVLETRIREKIGNGGFGRELAEGIRTYADGPMLVVDHRSNDTTHLAEHVQQGGVIRPKRHRYLAIPIDKSVRGEWPSDHSWATDDGKPVFLRRKSGPGWIMAEKRGKKKEIKPLFALVPETKPQRPRPFWLTDAETMTLAEKETAWWLEKTLPREI